eukprot:1157579-Pelagomonas_calceolata.AAC.3
MDDPTTPQLLITHSASAACEVQREGGRLEGMSQRAFVPTLSSEPPHHAHAPALLHYVWLTGGSASGHCIAVLQLLLWMDPDVMFYLRNAHVLLVAGGATLLLNGGPASGHCRHAEPAVVN